jgi:hypothetical protein
MGLFAHAGTLNIELATVILEAVPMSLRRDKSMAVSTLLFSLIDMRFGVIVREQKPGCLLA